MEIILARPKSGRTSKLIEISKDTGYTIVCRNNETVRRLQSITNEIPRPITFQELRSKTRGSSNIKGLLIDDADELLQMYAKNVPIKWVVMAQEEYEYEKKPVKWWKFMWNLGFGYFNDRYTKDKQGIEGITHTVVLPFIRINWGHIMVPVIQ